MTPDQRALLRLLLSGDTYEHVGEVLGIGRDQVRSRAHDAAADLEGAKDDELSAEAVRRRLNELDEPGQAGEQSPVGAAATPRRTGRPWALWIAAAGVAIAAIVVLFVVVGGGSGNDGTTTSTRGGQEDVVPIKLTPVGQAKGSGGFSVVRVADQPAVDLAIAGLEPSGRGESYVLWFIGSGGRSLPVAFRAVGTDGKLTGRATIPSAAEGLLPSFDTAELTLSRQQEAAAAVQRAAQSATLPQVVGTPVMRGNLR